jgi:hypothetical protein
MVTFLSRRATSDMAQSLLVSEPYHRNRHLPPLRISLLTPLVPDSSFFLLGAVFRYRPKR